MASNTKITFFMIFVVYMTLINLIVVSGHPHQSRRQRSHNHHQNNQRQAPSDETILSRRRQSSDNNDNLPAGHHQSGKRNKHVDNDNYDDDEDDDGRHAYVMRRNNDHQTSSPSASNTDGNGRDKADEDQTLTQAFEKHMRPSNKNFKNTHDVYAYQLPSDLWFIVRYAKTAEGQVEKYMNIVDSFTNYLDKLDQGVKTVSVNVKGVETVFRLTSKSKH